ncbi:hypothetical protein [Bifidobacterium cuniculi]|nr:hypothetical protein [Bifidobacterium cuniculi]
MIADQRDAVRVMHPGDSSRWAVAVAGVLCMGAVMPFLPWAAHHAVFVALCAMSAVACCAACVNAFPGGGTRMHGVARANMVVGLLGTLASGATLLCDLSPALLAALVISVAICAMQLMPNLVVHVPDRYLVEWRTYMSTRWTVRGTIPQEARILRARDVQPDMDGFLASYDAGIVWCTCLVPLAYAGLAQWAPADTPWSRIGLLVLTVSLVCWLLLRPR